MSDYPVNYICLFLFVLLIFEQVVLPPYVQSQGETPSGGCTTVTHTHKTPLQLALTFTSAVVGAENCENIVQDLFLLEQLESYVGKGR